MYAFSIFCYCTAIFRWCYLLVLKTFTTIFDSWFAFSHILTTNDLPYFTFDFIIAWKLRKYEWKKWTICLWKMLRIHIWTREIGKVSEENDRDCGWDGKLSTQAAVNRIWLRSINYSGNGTMTVNEKNGKTNGIELKMSKIESTL